ncbi:MAG: DUF1800 family protein [Dehalococcoidia bacterium]
MSSDAIALRSHLMRRVGVGATRNELEAIENVPYEELVEKLLYPLDEPYPTDDLNMRYFPAIHQAPGGISSPDSVLLAANIWIFNMVNGRDPLREKMALFWHHVLATAWFKSENSTAIVNQINTFRKNGLLNLREILLDVSRDPAMIDWLDNCENHSNEINENYGRELLELFSMGIGNYTEDDIKSASRAFTGWTFQQPVPLYPYGLLGTKFEYHEEDHDDGEKEFLGNTGNFNGEDIIDIIVQQDACARFISRHLYNFFVADESQVPAWNIEEPKDPEAVQTLCDAFREFDGDMRAVMRVLLNSEFFKNTRFSKVKSPAEFVGGAIKLANWPHVPDPTMSEWGAATTAMGQKLLDPPTVEGWHTGKEWLDGGTLTERVNFAVGQVTDIGKPGVRSMIDRLRNHEGPVTPDNFVGEVLDFVGPIIPSEETLSTLNEFAAEEGDLVFDNNEQNSEERVGRMMQLVVACPEYQFA